MQRWFCTQVGNFTKARAWSLPPDKKVVDLLHHVIHVGHKESTCFIKWISPTQVTTFNSRNKYSFLLLLWHNWTFELSTFPLPPVGVKYLCGRRPLNHPLPLNNPPIVPLYLRILLLRRGHEGQRTEVMRLQIEGRTIIPLTIEQPPSKKC